MQTRGVDRWTSAWEGQGNHPVQRRPLQPALGNIVISVGMGGLWGNVALSDRAAPSLDSGPQLFGPQQCPCQSPSCPGLAPHADFPPICLSFPKVGGKESDTSTPSLRGTGQKPAAISFCLREDCGLP